MRYPFHVFQTEVEGHVFWVAKSNYLKGCVGQGDVQEDAIRELAENEEAWLETAHETGIPIPEIEPVNPDEYSGKMTLRMSPAIHREAAMIAKEEGISLNQYINDAVVSKNAYMLRMYG
ncbi:MAG: type II toxin-antitoxin system HicB family antitoxin [Lachnospiraceae bacterium]|nr:type II toxin-antitoxin system HicB family antitoxin [Lachnospiraceae bacterium]